MQIDTQQYVCRRCVCEGQRSEIVSLTAFHNARLSCVEESLQAAKKHEHELVTDLAAQKALTQDAQAKHRDLLEKHRDTSAQLSVVQSQLQTQTDQTEKAKADSLSLAVELQTLELAHSKIKKSKADYSALANKHQITCQRVQLLKTKLEAKHEQYIVAGQTAQRLEKERDAAKDWAARETLKALEQRQQKEIVEQQLARETSVLRYCNSKIVKNLKQCEKVKRELEVQLIRQAQSSPDPDGTLLIYVKEMLPGWLEKTSSICYRLVQGRQKICKFAGKQKIAKDVKIACVDMDWKTGALLTQFFEDEQVRKIIMCSIFF